MTELRMKPGYLEKITLDMESAFSEEYPTLRLFLEYRAGNLRISVTDVDCQPIAELRTPWKPKGR